MRVIASLHSCCFLLVFLFTAIPSQAQPDPFQPDGYTHAEIMQGSYEYDIQSGTMTVRADSRGIPSVYLGDITITAETVTFNDLNRVLTAQGDVKFWNKGTILRGSELRYHLDREEGWMRDVQQVELSENVYFSGKLLTYRQVPAKDQPEGATEVLMQPEYVLHEGTVTTNDMPVPYYYIKYDRVRLVPNVRWWAHDLFYYAQSWPLFYVPYYTRSLREHKVVYSLDVGHFSKLGFAFFNRLSIDPHDYFDVDIFADYYTDAGFGKGARMGFDVEGEYGPKGEIYGYHIHQEAPDNDYIRDGEDRGVLYGTYEQDLPYDLRLVARGHYISDSEYRWDYRSSEWRRDIDIDHIERDFVSYISLSRNWEDMSLRLTGASRLDPFYYSGLPYVEREPQIHYEYYSTPIFDTNFYLDYHADFGRYRRELGQTFPLNPFTLFDQTDFVDEVDRFDTEARISFPYTFPYRITAKPWVGARFTNYSDPTRWVDDPTIAGYSLDAFNFEDENRAMLEGGLDLSTRRTWEFSPFLSRYERMRLVYEPIIQYAYFLPGTDLEEILAGPGVRFPYIDPTDEYRYEMHRIATLLRTRIEGQNAEGMTGTFMDFSIGTAYDYMPDNNLLYDNFEFFDDFASNPDHRFMDLIESFNIYPYDWLTFGNFLRLDIDDEQIRSAYYYTRVQPIRPLRVSMGFYTYRYLPFDTEEQRDLTLQVLYDLSTKWQLYYSTRYDIDRSEFRRNYVGVMRDMYDFFALFQIEHESHPTLGDDFSVQFGIRFWGIGGRRSQNQPMPVY